jgi:hypothetical protein
MIWKLVLGDLEQWKDHGTDTKPISPVTVYREGSTKFIDKWYSRPLSIGKTIDALYRVSDFSCSSIEQQY